SRSPRRASPAAWRRPPQNPRASARTPSASESPTVPDRRMKRLFFATTTTAAAKALALGVLLPAVAAAAPPGADRAAARTLGFEGEDALARKDYTTAADRYARAEALFHAPTLLLGLARAHVGLGKLVAARETYQRIVADGVPPNGPPVFVEAVASAQRELAEV